MKKILILCLYCVALSFGSLHAQERVYISTDKSCYVAGESIWCSVYCLDEEGYSDLSSVAYLQFFSSEGVKATIKLGLIEGRGCGRFEIPFSFATGNYSIVAYTKRYGGESLTEFNGKVVTIFNTLTVERVEGGVEVLPAGKEIDHVGAAVATVRGAVELEVPENSVKGMNAVPIKLRNLSGKRASLNISVYHVDELEKMVTPERYSSSSLLERTGEFRETAEVDYAGEVIKVKLSGEDGNPAVGKNVYMSAVDGDMDVYVAVSDSAGVATYYTNNIYGERDLVFDVASDFNIARSISRGDVGEQRCGISLVEASYKHKTAAIPVLEISAQMRDALVQRAMNMQIAKRFEADTIYNLMKMRANPLLGDVVPVVYNLDDYTRFPVMTDVIREYVRGLRIRKYGKEEDIQVLWESSMANFSFTEGHALALLDGVPVRNHKLLVDMDPLLVRQIVVYQRQFAMNNFLFDGIVEFKTYKGDMGGISLGEDVSIISCRGVEYPLAFFGNRVAGNPNYPNYNSTIYWNPVVDIEGKDVYEFECQLPAYKGEFRVVVEGLDEDGSSIYASDVFKVE